MGLGSLGKLFFGSGAKTEQLPTLTGDQQKFLSQLFGVLGMDPSALDLGQNDLYQAGSNSLMDLLNGNTDAIEAPIMQQFQNEILPQIAQRFGGLGAQSSSGYQNALAGAGSNLATQLGAQRFGAQQQGIGQALNYAGQRAQGLQGLAGLGLGTKAFGYQSTPSSPGVLDAVLGGFGSMAGNRLALPKKLGGFF